MTGTIKEKAKHAKEASILMASISKGNKALLEIAKSLKEKKEFLIRENQKDLEESKDIGNALLKRLLFDEKKIDELVKGLNDLAEIDDPVGKTLKVTELDQGLELYKVSSPIGVIGVVFESRPDALVQISSLCLKSGNSVLLKGGKEALHTNKALFNLIKEVSEKNNIPKGWIQLIETREDVNEMLKLDEYIDLIVPRGSNAFVKYVMDHTNIPVLGHSDGICHIYVDKDVDIDLALKVCFDAKCQYAAVCNALETLLVNSKIAEEFLPRLKNDLETAKVRLLGDEKTLKIIDIGKADEEDWSTEYNDLILSIKIVDNLDDAINHINRYGSRHTDAIITKDKENAKRFMQLVDSANVFWNCSTRFADGYRYGLGAEVGISTAKIHARGPVGLDGLMIYKWKLIGKGHIAADYSDNKKSFTHKKLNKEFPLK
ncbi:MAG: glutamate-5-semialdehyde dehydrogenase [Nanoarchaeota archaeon]|nr:glutamate-5-semialdehyde dehydrogenase [Nanoarchaeota archaeon]